MVNKIEGKLVASNLKIGIVVSRFNEAIVQKLVDGALDTLNRHAVDDDAVNIAYVPGAFEVPVIAKRMAKTGNYDAIITLGAVIRGATSHFEIVANNAASGVASAALETEVPIIFGILTVENIDQAIERAGTKAGNNGSSAALAAIEMANLIKVLEG